MRVDDVASNIRRQALGGGDGEHGAVLHRPGVAGTAAQMLLATSLDSIQLEKRGFKMRWMTWRGQH